ncbi:MAG TPA: class I SAM-dependent methyltransferase [Candidatus Paceibacterota bacterium]
MIKVKLFLRKCVNSNQSLVKKLLGIFIRLHNYSYKKITEYSSILNGGFNPKHEVTKYHDYFVSKVNNTDSVLDIGCGVGYLAYDIASKAKKVVGIDFSVPNIDNARSQYKRDNLEFVLGDVTTYNFKGQFDKLILSNVLEHIADRVALLKKIRALGGTLLFRVPMVDRDWVTVYKRDHGYPYKLDDTHETEYTLEQVKEEMKASGWIIESYQVNWGEFWGVLTRDDNFK